MIGSPNPPVTEFKFKPLGRSDLHCVHCFKLSGGCRVQAG